MKKTLSTLACLITLSWGTSVLATPFQISETTIDVSAIGIGLINWTSNASGLVDLDEGEYFDYNFGTVSYFGLGAGNIDFQVNFATPELDSLSDIGTFAGISFGIFSFRGIEFGDPVYADYSYNGYTGGKLKLDFNDIDFDFAIGSTDVISGRITNVSDATTAPVPEPSTMLLFGAGLAGLVGYNRRRSSK